MDFVIGGRTIEAMASTYDETDFSKASPAKKRAMMWETFREQQEGTMSGKLGEEDLRLLEKMLVARQGVMVLVALASIGVLSWAAWTGMGLAIPAAFVSVILLSEILIAGFYTTHIQRFIAGERDAEAEAFKQPEIVADETLEPEYE